MSHRIVLQLSSRQKVRYRKKAQREKDAALKGRYQIILMYGEGQGCKSIARALGCAPSTATSVAKRYRALGEAGLLDGRKDPKATKVTPDHAGLLTEMLSRTPRQYGWRSFAWTRELMTKVLQQETGEVFSITTVARLLQALKAKNTRAKPIVGCPWPKRKRQKRLRKLEQLAFGATPQEPVFYVDEVDIHLNPKIGYDWTLPGKQKEVFTPGKNQKHYVAGALSAEGRCLYFVDGPQKNSELFIALLQHLQSLHPKTKRLHVIVDNFVIHSSEKTQTYLNEQQGRLVLHFLPPYCPQENKIERRWKNLHQNVTRHHRHEAMAALMDDVRADLRGERQLPHSVAQKVPA